MILAVLEFLIKKIKHLENEKFETMFFDISFDGKSNYTIKDKKEGDDEADEEDEEDEFCYSQGVLVENSLIVHCYFGSLEKTLIVNLIDKKIEELHDYKLENFTFNYRWYVVSINNKKSFQIFNTRTRTVRTYKTKYDFGSKLLFSDGTIYFQTSSGFSRFNMNQDPLSTFFMSQITKTQDSSATRFFYNDLNDRNLLFLVQSYNDVICFEDEEKQDKNEICETDDEYEID